MSAMFTFFGQGNRGFISIIKASQNESFSRLRRYLHGANRAHKRKV